LRVQSKSGTKKATIAQARKALCILYHLLINGEMYREEELKKNILSSNCQTSSKINISVDEMIKLLAKAGYEVRPNRSGLGEL
jgi:transposase